MQIVSQVAEQLKTWDLRKLGNIRKNLKTSQNDSLVPSLPAKMKILLKLANDCSLKYLVVNRPFIKQ